MAIVVFKDLKISNNVISSMAERAGDDGQTRKKKDARTQSAVGTNELLCWTMLRLGRDHWLDLTRRHKALKAWHK
jgi:hypothetical protein